ncbi:MAG: DUF2095 family protein [Candidatus Methanofastidiosa archaeon]|nr:DUF2095 family protein [Candidatus Methanofastidiosa archaeon]
MEEKRKKTPPHRSADKMTVDYDSEDFETSLPYLYKELADPNSPGRLSIGGISKDMEPENESEGSDDLLIDFDGEKQLPYSSENSEMIEDTELTNQEGLKNSSRTTEDITDIPELQNPQACDFIRRCNTNKEAFEILEYLVKKKEISAEDALKYRLKIEKNGLNSFGEKKTWGYYERKYSKNITPFQ